MSQNYKWKHLISLLYRFPRGYTCVVSHVIVEKSAKFKSSVCRQILNDYEAESHNKPLWMAYNNQETFET